MVKIKKYPDKTGHFGKFGGQFAPETLMHALEELNSFYMSIKNSKEFKNVGETLSQEAVDRKSHDNITIIAIKFKDPPIYK